MGEVSRRRRDVRPNDTRVVCGGVQPGEDGRLPYVGGRVGSEGCHGEEATPDSTGEVARELTATEIEGGYHVLCAAVLAHTANLLGGFDPDGSSRRNHRLAGRPSRAKRKYFREEVAAQRFTAKQWVRGGGVLSFDECCEELGYSPAPARQKMLEIADIKP